MKPPTRYGRRCQCLCGCRVFLDDSPLEQRYDLSNDGPIPVLVTVPVCEKCYQEVQSVSDPW